MTPDEINITISEHLGWKAIEKSGPFFVGYPPEPKEEIKYIIPSYYTDLNYIHKAAQTLSNRQKEIFAECLCCLDEKDYEIPHEKSYIGYIEMPARSSFDYVNETASKRAEAFLKTIGKWIH